MSNATRAFDATRSYDFVRLTDGCFAIRDLTDGFTAHGTNKGDFDNFRYNGMEWSFTNTDAIDDTTEPEPLYSALTVGETLASNPALAALWEALGEEANARGWCSEYDAFAQAHGGPERPKRKVYPNLQFTIGLPIEMREGDIDEHDYNWAAAFNAQHTALQRRERVRESFKSRLAYAAEYYSGQTPDDEIIDSIARYLGDYISIEAIVD